MSILIRLIINHNPKDNDKDIEITKTIKVVLKLRESKIETTINQMKRRGPIQVKEKIRTRTSSHQWMELREIPIIKSITKTTRKSMTSKTSWIALADKTIL